MGRGGISKGRAWAIVTIIVVSAIVALGVGLGLGLRKNKSDGSSADKQCACAEQGTSLPTSSQSPPTTQTTRSQSPPTTLSPLYVKPSVSIEGHYRFAAVAPDAQECANIGTRIMAVDGGTAIDAAIATILCVGIHNPMSCGIGGGHFLTFYNRSSGEATAVIAREMAPSAATEDMYAEGKNTSSTTGGLAIGVPGEISGLYAAHQLGGRLPWATLLQPAIKLCRDGFRVGHALAKAVKSSRRFYSEFPNLREMVTNPETRNEYQVGEIMRRPVFARTLEIIARKGPNAFYNGSLSKNITDDIAEAGGKITENDLAHYEALVVPALNTSVHPNYTAFSPPPPSTGAVFLSIMNILNGFNMSADSVSSPTKAVLTYHRIAEAFKHTYSFRTQLGDYNIGSDNFKQYVHEVLNNMTSSEFGEETRSKIDDSQTFGADFYEPKFYNVWDSGTSHLSVLGPNGDAVAITSTVNLYFGSKVVGRRTGIIFNNEMDDFSTPNTTNFFGVPASPANFIEPRKRPLSSMCPSVVVGPDGDVALVVGAAGGTRITTATALTTMNTLWFGWGVKQAVDYPRIHHQLFPQELFVEPGMPKVIIEGLRQKGHNITQQESFECVVQAIRRTDRQITANSDFRKDGIPDGF